MVGIYSGTPGGGSSTAKKENDVWRSDSLTMEL